jgi:hypothetical protein
VAIGVAAFAIAGAALGALTVQFTEWLLTTADANRNLALNREAFTGSAKEADRLGNIIAHTREEVALTTEKLNELAIANDKNLRGFRISGVGMAHQFHAIALAAGAGRDDVVAAFNEIIGRGKLTGRTFVSLRDFQPGGILAGKGIKAADLFKELGVQARGGIVSTDKMAAALDKLSTNRFAEINAKKAVSLGALWDRMKDNFLAFTNDLVKEGGALEPLLNAFKELADEFDLSTASGQSLKQSVTEYGKAIATWIVGHKDDIKAFVDGVIKLAGAFIEAGAAVVKFAQSDTGLTAVKIALLALASAGVAVFVAFLPLIVVGAAIAVAFIAVGAAIYGVYKLGQWIANLDWAGIGKSIVDGIKNGLQAAWEGLKSAIIGQAEGIKTIFKTILGIASPSKVFLEYGVQTGAGFQAGLVASQAGVQSAGEGLTQAVATGAASGAVATPAAASGGGGGMSIGTIENHFHIAAGAGAEQVKEALSSQSFLESLESSIKVLFQSQGIPTSAPVPSGG